ncbi:transcription factor TGA4-like protein [Tanacetum coccineum]
MSDKLPRRLAQNREAARKSRLRKKAYVQQLETRRLKLAQLEQELERGRQDLASVFRKKGNKFWPNVIVDLDQKKGNKFRPKKGNKFRTNVIGQIKEQMGGINSLLSVEYLHSISLVSRTPTIIFVMDVSHGSAGCSDVPSIAAIRVVLL